MDALSVQNDLMDGHEEHLHQLDFINFWRMDEKTLKEKLHRILNPKITWMWNSNQCVLAFHSALLQELENLDEEICALVVASIDRLQAQLSHKSPITLKLIFFDPQLAMIFKKLTTRSEHFINSLYRFEFQFIFDLLKRYVYSPFLEPFVVKIAESLVVQLKFGTCEDSKLEGIKQLFLAFDTKNQELYLNYSMKAQLLRDLKGYYFRHVNLFGEFKGKRFQSEISSFKRRMHIFKRQLKMKQRKELNKKTRPRKKAGFYKDLDSDSGQMIPVRPMKKKKRGNICRYSSSEEESDSDSRQMIPVHIAKRTFASSDTQTAKLHMYKTESY